MKALSIKQPWASLIANGHKTIELRTWKTDCRGPLAIHASKGFDRESLNILRMFCEDKEIPEEYPRGIIAVCNLKDIIRFGGKRHFDMHSDKHYCPSAYFEVVPYGWVLTDIKKLETPIPVKGRLGLWEWEE